MIIDEALYVFTLQALNLGEIKEQVEQALNLVAGRKRWHSISVRAVRPPNDGD